MDTMKALLNRDHERVKQVKDSKGKGPSVGKTPQTEEDNSDEVGESWAGLAWVGKRH